jgi:octaprenyl-diphosphate synthase
MQLTTAKNTETTEDEYLDVIRAKTAALFSAAAEAGPSWQGRPGRTRRVPSYGLNLGIAFQLVDDALDYGGQTPTLGKNIGDDFREGQGDAARRAGVSARNQADREFWARALVGGQIAHDDLRQAVALLERTRALKDTVERARHYGAMARDALAPLPDAPAKARCWRRSPFCIARAH